MATYQAKPGRAKAGVREGQARPGTRERLVNAATELMWEYGLGDVSVDMILARAEVLKGSFYHFFPAKSDLLLECVDNIWRRESEELAAIYAEAEDPRTALRRHLKMFRQGQADMRKRLGFVPGTFNMSMPNSILRDEPRITVKLRELMTSHEHYLEIGLRRLAESDGLAQPADTTARLLRYAMTGALLSARMHNSLKPLDDVETILAEMLNAG
jgi:TetR/AcrR family transcriptional repressor of nem operon